MNFLIKNFTSILPQIKKIYLTPGIKNAQFHTFNILNAWGGNKDAPTHFLDYNKKVYPPQSPDEPRRPAYVCHLMPSIKYSPWKMWYIAAFIRGMTIDEALKQLSFIHKKGSIYVRTALLEAQEKAVKEHNVEFKTNLWVAESFVTKSHVIKGIRRHAKARMGKVEYFYCHYFVRLEEGPPPKHYHPHKRELSGQEHLDKWLERLRERKIPNSL